MDAASDEGRPEPPSVTLAVGFRDADLEGAFTAFMSSSNAKSTKKDYSGKWNMWVKYLGTLGGRDQQRATCPYLSDIVDPLEKSYIWARYVYYLRELCRVPPQRISSYMAAVKYHLVYGSRTYHSRRNKVL